MDNLSLFVDTLQELMSEKNIKPADIHKSTKINLSVIYDWLKKSAVPTLKSLLILSEYFQCSVEYLLGRTEHRQCSVLADKQTFAERLRLLLNTKKVSIRKLSNDTKTAKSAISYFLNGSVEPLLDNLIKLADYFDVTVDYLIGIEN